MQKWTSDLFTIRNILQLYNNLILISKYNNKFNKWLYLKRTGISDLKIQ